ncbi:MAG: ArsR/SmtB family transcription factor [Bdellovibrionales bacterium]
MKQKQLKQNATAAAEFVKSFAHPARLMVLCALTEGEMSVSHMLKMIPIGQTALSQHLSRLRHEGLVTYRRENTTLYYSLSDMRVKGMVNMLYKLFCK